MNLIDWYPSSKQVLCLCPLLCQMLTNFQKSFHQQSQQWLHCALSLAVQCTVIGPVCGFVFVCGWVCYHDNSILRASIFTKLGLNFGCPALPGRGSAMGRKFLAPPYYSQRLSERFFHCVMDWSFTAVVGRSRVSYFFNYGIIVVVVVVVVMIIGWLCRCMKRYSTVKSSGFRSSRWKHWRKKWDCYSSRHGDPSNHWSDTHTSVYYYKMLTQRVSLCQCIKLSICMWVSK